MMAESGSEPRAFEADVDDYDVVRVSLSWGLLSLAAFLIVVTLQLFEFESLNLRYIHILVVTMVLSPVGFILGLIGMKFGRSRQLARIGAFLNGSVLFCILILVPLAATVSRLIR